MKDRKKKKFKLKKVFSLILISYIFMLCIPVILSGYLIYMVNNLTVERYRETVEGSLEQSSLLLEKRMEVMEKNAQSLINNYQLMQIARLDMLQPGDKNVVQVRELQKYLKKLFPEDLSGYAVVLRNGYAFTSTSMTLGREFFFEKSRKYKDMSYEEWLERSFYSKSRVLYPLQDINLGTGTVRAVTYSMPVGSYNMPKEADGCVQFFIEESVLRDIFLPILRMEQCLVVVYADNSGVAEPVAMLSAQQDGQAPATGTEVPAMPVTEDTKGFVELGGADGKERQEAVYMKSQSGGFTAVAYIPRELILKETQTIRVILFWLVGISLLIEIGLGIYFSLRYSSPIKNLILNIQNILKPEGKKDTLAEPEPDGEYAQLESGVNWIIRKNNELSSELVKRETKEKKDFYRGLLTGVFGSEEEVRMQMSELDINIEGMGYSVAVFGPAAEAETEMLREVLREGGGQSVLWVQAVEYNTQAGNAFVAVLLGSGEEAEAADCVAAGLHELVCGRLERRMPGGLGRTYQRFTDISFSYTQALYCVRKLQRGDGGQTEADTERVGLTVYDNLSQNLNTLYYPAELEEKLINSTRHGEEAHVEEIFRQIYEENAVKRHLTDTMERLLSANIMATLLKVYSDMIPEEQIDTLLGKRSETANVGEMLNNQKQQFLKVCREFARSRSGRQEEQKKQFEAYIEQNYNDCQMSVKSAADYFDLSESYFSIVFKETTGEAFSAYLERVRLFHARKLLEEKVGVEAVAEKVGYNNSGTFRRAFKRAMGVSPTEWLEK